MSRTEIISAMSMALEFCSKYCCCDCPKSHACVRIFDWIFLNQEILELAKKCQKFNESLDNDKIG